jgi:lipopolysaccharide assembly protein B
VSAEYFQGLNYLLNEEPDKALEVFIRMVDMEADTVDTHFALGALFRRSGETERAIKVHQNLVARPDLPREARARALNELAEDYFKAGLFDRAEQVYTQVAKGEAQRVQGLRGLVRIYELQRDWEKAIGAMDQLASLSRESGGDCRGALLLRAGPGRDRSRRPAGGAPLAEARTKRGSRRRPRRDDAGRDCPARGRPQARAAAL